MSDPKLYKVGIANLFFSKYVFFWWIIYGIWQSALLYFVSFLSYEKNGGCFYLEGNFVYTGVVIIANIKILSDSSTHSVFSWFFIFGSIIVYIGADLFAANIPESDLFGVIGNMVNSREFYLIIVFVCLAVIYVDVGFNYITFEYW